MSYTLLRTKSVCKRNFNGDIANSLATVIQDQEKLTVSSNKDEESAKWE